MKSEVWTLLCAMKHLTDLFSGAPANTIISCSYTGTTHSSFFLQREDAGIQHLRDNLKATTPYARVATDSRHAPHVIAGTGTSYKLPSYPDKIRSVEPERLRV